MKSGGPCPSRVPGLGSAAPWRSESLNSVGTPGRWWQLVPAGRGPPRGSLRVGKAVWWRRFECCARVALVRVAARHSAGRSTWAARGAPSEARARQLSEYNLSGLREASPAGHVPRRGDSGSTERAYWSDRLRPDAVLGFPTGVRLPFPPGPEPRGKRVAASVALLLASGCWEVRPGRLSPARGSSLSVFRKDGAGLILRTGFESAWAIHISMRFLVIIITQSTCRKIWS